MKATGKMRGHTVRWQHWRLVRPSKARLAHDDTVRYLIIRIRMISPVNIVLGWAMAAERGCSGRDRSWFRLCEGVRQYSPVRGDWVAPAPALWATTSRLPSIPCIILIITHKVANEGSDRSQLSPVAKQAKATLEVEKLDAVADRGYFDSEEILACENAGITVTLPKPMTSNAKAQGRFGKQDFRYVAQRMFTFALPAKSSPTPSRPRTKVWSCVATGPTPARVASSRMPAPLQRND